MKPIEKLKREHVARVVSSETGCETRDKLNEVIERVNELSAQHDRCPCGGIIIAETEECRVPLCDDCASEIVAAYS